MGKEGTNTTLRVATDLRHVQVDDSHGHPQDVIHEGTVYRRLDALLYAWLRRRMERAKKAHDANKLNRQTWETLRERFNAIHEWAVAHIGERALVDAIASLDENSYLSPRHDHAIAIVESWDERAAIMEYDGGLDRDTAEQSAANLISRELTPEDVESFKTLGVEVHVKSNPGDFTLVPEYTDRAGQERIEISADDLRKLSMITHTFPGTEITYVGPQKEIPGEPYVPQPAYTPTPKPTPQPKPTQPPHQARLL